MRQKPGLPALVQLAILTLITTFTWLGFEVFRSFTKVTPVEVDAQILAPIVPELDELTLDRLIQRTYLEDSEIGDTVLLDPDSNVLDPDEETIQVPSETVDSTDQDDTDISIFDEPQEDSIESTQSE